jgi:hypothetical protein
MLPVVPLRPSGEVIRTDGTGEGPPGETSVYADCARRASRGIQNMNGGALAAVLVAVRDQ